MLLGASALSGVLGTIHAFSIFIAPFEAKLAAQRWLVSLVYSIALVCLTIAVLVSHRLFARMSGSMLVAAVGIATALGLLIAAQATSFAVLVLAYGVVFGSANGVGYAFSLHIAAAANPGRPGLAIGVVTAAYALGAAAAALLLDDIVRLRGPAVTLRLLALGVVAVALAVSLGLRRSGGDAASVRSVATSNRATMAPAVMVRLWVAYGFAVVAGLTALGHAAPLVEAAGGSESLSVRSVAMASFANAGGGIIVAVIADRVRPRSLMVGLPIVSAFALLFLAVASDGLAAAFGLALVALVYGAVIAFYPFVVMRVAGTAAYAASYGRVFTAWGVAGIVGPVAAGATFDLTGGYGPALVLAALAAAGSAIVASRIAVP